MTVTMDDIARQSKVSRSLVSLVLNNRTNELRISEEAKSRVLAVAKELGYCHNQLARSVATGKSRIIALVSEDCGLADYTGLLQNGIFQAASKKNYAVKLHMFDGDDQKLLKSFQEWKIAGVLFRSGQFSRSKTVCDGLRKLNLPYGFLNQNNQSGFGYGVTTDDEAGAYAMTHHLLEQGATRLLCVTSCGTADFITQRVNGFRRALNEYNIPKEWIVFQSNAEEFQLEEMKKFLTENSIDAVFATSDLWAMEVMRAAWELGLAIPEKLLLAGFGDLSVSTFAPLPLSTVHQDYEKMGFLATEAVIRAIENPDDAIFRQAVNVLLPTELRLRKSSSKN